jgi:hypothetical protein
VKAGQKVSAIYDQYKFIGEIVKAGSEFCVVRSDEDNCKYQCLTSSIKQIKTKNNGKRV